MKLALIGGGGFAKEAADLAKLNNYEIGGYFSDKNITDRWNYLGCLSDINTQKNDFLFAFCIGAVNSEGIKKRRFLIDEFQNLNLQFVNLISPNAYIAEGVKLGNGIVIAHGVILSVDSFVDDFCLLNTNSVVGHDSYLGPNSVLAPLSFVAGNVRIEKDVLVGPNASVLEGRTVGSGSTIGTGASVFRDIKPNGIVMPVVTKTLY
jgi:sugar O-acyltransferase (sialic acid O-acetyltransferase NeuD family)